MRNYAGIYRATIICLLGFGFCWYMISASIQNEKEKVQDVFEHDASLLIDRVQLRFQDVINNTVRLGIISQSLNTIDQKKYAEFMMPSNTGASLKRSLLVKGRRLSGAAVEAFLDRQDSPDAKNFVKVLQGNALVQDTAFSESKEYFLVESQIANNLKWGNLVNFDMGSIEELRPYLVALEVNNSAKVLPILNSFGGFEFKKHAYIVLVPARSKNGDVAFVGNLVFLEDILNSLFSIEAFSDLILEIDDLYLGANDNKTDFLTATDLPESALEYVGSMQVGEQHWRLVVKPKASAYQSDYNSVMTTATMSIVLVALFLTILIMQNRRTARIQGMISRRTEALRLAHEELESRNSKLQHLNNELALAKYNAEESNKAKSEFLATMSHELRTPLNSVLGFAEIIKSESLGSITEPRYIDYADNIHQSGSHLLAMINDILDLAKLEAGKLTISPTNVMLDIMFKKVVALIQPLADEKNLELSLSLDPNLPRDIFADDNRIRQILINLLSNAVKFTPAGKIVVEAILLDDYMKQPYWQIKVQDTGIGIPAESIDALFQRFSQVDHGVAREFGGTGLGLAICQELVTRMKGRITVESEVNIGTTFMVTLPLSEAQDEDDNSDLL
ncbi:ATP-binding protein [Temperatibacter marinus]|uniref:histidine kinase n=1 Tax=Temperatibacter marinus TaxID=1456591 RepID=A0AA52H955_9PROT|nr:ATP-binding protein [Temperatibacter marinus]WND02826.1 ATP-binding protein [Temperatibacter marinus]